MLQANTAITINDLLALGFPENNPGSDASSQNHLNSFIDGHKDGIVMLNALPDRDGKLCDFTYAFINGTAERLLKRPRHEMIGKTLLELFPATQKEGIYDIYKKVYETGRTAVLQFHYAHEGFNTTFRQKIEKFEKGILVHTAEISTH